MNSKPILLELNNVTYCGNCLAVYDKSKEEGYPYCEGLSPLETELVELLEEFISMPTGEGKMKLEWKMIRLIKKVRG